MSNRNIALLVLGACLVILGIVAWLNALGITNISMGQVCGVGWSLILVAVGALIIRRAMRPEDGLPATLRRDKYLGDIRIGGQDWDLKDMDIQMGVGEVHLDLAGARIPPGETVIRVSGWVGDIRIWVPGDLAVRAQGGTWVGAANLLGNRRDGFFQEFVASSPGYDAAGTKVRIVAEQLIGAIRVVRAS